LTKSYDTTWRKRAEILIRNLIFYNRGSKDFLTNGPFNRRTDQYCQENGFYVRVNNLFYTLLQKKK